MNTTGRIATVLLLTLGLAACGDDDSTVAPQTTGTITVDVQPDGIDASWRITGPGGLVRAGVDDATMGDLPIGDYEIEWNEVFGRVSPNPQSATLDGGNSLVFDGLYPVSQFPAPLVSAGGLGRSQVIKNLEMSYEQLHYEQYEKVINQDYVFRFDPADTDIVGAAELSAIEDLHSTHAMFSGEFGVEPVLDPVTGLPTGEYKPVPPVQSIRMDLIPVGSSSWTQMPSGELAGTWRRIYSVDVTVTYAGSSRIDQIRGVQIFYVTEGTVDEVEVWQLRAWEDQGIDSAPALSFDRVTEAPAGALTFGQLKSHF